jgi:hypothetical protein
MGRVRVQAQAPAQVLALGFLLPRGMCRMLLMWMGRVYRAICLSLEVSFSYSPVVEDCVVLLELN